MADPSSTRHPVRPLRIFVVDDHRDSRDMTQMYLEACGYVVTSAGTMTAALEALPQADCDVLLSDIGLPDGTGCELLRRLQMTRPIYAIAMSGFGLGEDQRRSQEAGFRHHLLKPISIKELDAALVEAARHGWPRPGQRGRERCGKGDGHECGRGPSRSERCLQLGEPQWLGQVGVGARRFAELASFAHAHRSSKPSCLPRGTLNFLGFIPVVRRRGLRLALQGVLPSATHF